MPTTGEKLLSALSLARRAGALVCGSDEVCRAAQKGAARLVLLAADTAENTDKRVRTACGTRVAIVQAGIAQQDIAAVTRKPVAVLAITDKNLAVLCKKCCQDTAETAH